MNVVEVFRPPDRGPQGRDGFGPGSFGRHEPLDRASRARNAVDGWSLSHPACVANGGRFGLARRAFDALSELDRRVADSHREAGAGAESPADGDPS